MPKPNWYTYNTISVPQRLLWKRCHKSCMSKRTRMSTVRLYLIYIIEKLHQGNPNSMNRLSNIKWSNPKQIIWAKINGISRCIFICCVWECMCDSVCLCVCVSVYTYVWRPFVTLRCHSSGDTDYICWDYVNPWPSWYSLLGYGNLPESIMGTKYLCLLPNPDVNSNLCLTFCLCSF